MAGLDSAAPAGAVYGRGPARPPVKRKPPGNANSKAAGERTLSDIAAGIPKTHGEKRRTRKNQSGLAKISESAEWELSSSAAAGSRGGDAGDEFEEVWAEAGLLEPAPANAATDAPASAQVEEQGDDGIEIFIGDADDDSEEEAPHISGQNVAEPPAAVVGEHSLGAAENGQPQDLKRPKAPSEAAPGHHPHHLHASASGGKAKDGQKDITEESTGVGARTGLDVELEKETVQIFLEDGDDSDDDDDIREPSSQDADLTQKASLNTEKKTKGDQNSVGHMAGWSDLLKATEPKISSSGAGAHRMAEAAEEAQVASASSEDEDEDEQEDEEEDDSEVLSGATVPLKHHQGVSHLPAARMDEKNGHGEGDGHSTRAHSDPEQSGSRSTMSTAQHPPAAKQQRPTPDLFAAMGDAVAQVEAGNAGTHAGTHTHGDQREPAMRSPRTLPTFDQIKASSANASASPGTSQLGQSQSTTPGRPWTCSVCTLINDATSHTCSACDASRSEATPAQPTPQKLGLLEMMDSAVQDTEAVNIDFEDEVDDFDDASKVIRESHPPEVAGQEDKAQASFDRTADARRAASGMTAQLLSSSNGGAAPLEPPKSKQRIVGKADVVDQFLKQPPKEDKENRPVADGSKFNMGPGLGGLRKAYDSGVAAGGGRVEQVSLPVASSRPKAPEETAEEESPQAGLESEWDDVGARTEVMQKEAQENYGKAVAVEDVSCQPISYKEVYQWILQLDVDYDVLRPYNQDPEDGGVRCGCLSKPRGGIPGLPATAQKEKDLLLFLKCTDFDFNNITHFRMLRTIYTKLTRNKSCASIGRHWEVLGFQAGDPRTDLNRSGGVLNVVQLFYFLSQHFEILKAAWLLSQDEQQNFPLACISIAITKMVVDAFLAGQLSSICKKSSPRGVLETINKLHTAGLYHFYSQWRHLKRTIRDTEQTYKEVSALLTRKPAKLLDLLVQGVESERARQDPSKLEFTNLDFGAAGGSGGAQSSKKAKAPLVPKRLRNYHDESGG